MPLIARSPRRLRATLCLAAAALSLQGCALLGRGDPPPDLSQDPRIQREVEARLAGEPSLAPGSIRVAVDAGIVQLHGNVQGLGAWQCAITTSGLVTGVRSVVDYLVLERGPRDVGCLAPRPDTSVVIGR